MVNTRRTSLAFLYHKMKSIPVFSWTTSVPHNTFLQLSSLALCCNDLMIFHQQTELLFHLLNELPHCEQCESRNHVSFTVFFFNIFIYLATSGLSCSMQDLLSSLWHAGPFRCSMQTLRYGMGDLVPWPEIEPGPPTLGAWSLSNWTTREVPEWPRFLNNIHLFLSLPARL